jgi:hypothetical protein
MACVESGDGWEVGRIGCRCLYYMQTSLLGEETAIRLRKSWVNHNGSQEYHRFM